MGKVNSYHDWELQFRKSPKKKPLVKDKPNELNSLGIPHNEFKSILREWAAKNL